MPSRYSPLVQLLLALVLLLPGVVSAQEPDDEADEAPVVFVKPTLHAGVLPANFMLTGRLTDPAWAAAPSIDTLTTIEPRQGEFPIARTVVKVLANSSEIVVGAHCFDPIPAGIVAMTSSQPRRASGVSIRRDATEPTRPATIRRQVAR